MAFDRLKKKAKDFPGIFENKKGVVYKKIQPEKFGVTREHNIPIKAVFKHLDELNKNGKLTEEYICNIQRKLSIMLVSKNYDNKKKNKKKGIDQKVVDEDTLLRSVQVSQSMPENWDKKKDWDMFARYKLAGIDMIDFTKEDLTAFCAKK